MPRVTRSSEPGVVYHLISRFVDREWFITRESERRQYLRLLGRSLRDSDWRCLSYAVMSNHIHLAMVAGEQGLDSWVRRVHGPFADWMNRAHDRIGGMFVRGPKQSRVPAHAVRDVIAYIHNNPVRAGVVTEPRKSRWTSHRAYVGLEPAPSWLHVDEGLRLSGFDSPRDFDRWVADPSRDVEARRLEEDEDIIALSASRVEPLVARPAPLSIVQATAEELSMSTEQLRSRRRGKREQIARQVAVQCAERVGLTGVDIATALGMSQQGVSVIRRRHPEADVTALCTRVLQRLGAIGASSANGASSV